MLGVEPDARMADFARAAGLPVEVSTLEAWEPAVRKFDTVIAARSWHWIAPVAGALKAAEVLRPNGRVAIFGHMFEPPPRWPNHSLLLSGRSCLTRPSATRLIGGVLTSTGVRAR